MGVVVVVVGSHHFIASLVSVVVVASSPMGEQTTAMRVSFCLSLCLSSRIFPKSHVRPSSNFLFLYVMYFRCVDDVMLAYNDQK